jgi:hypothetical protein
MDPFRRPDVSELLYIVRMAIFSQARNLAIVAGCSPSILSL